MRKFTLIIPKNLSGRDIKYVLRNHFGLSERMITRLKTDRGILLNGQKAYVCAKVFADDLLEINPPDTASENIVPSAVPIDVLYEDEDILAVNKPRNMPTHPSLHHFCDTLANAVAHYYRGSAFTFRAVSRLDRYTSGVVLIAKNAVSADKLNRLMRQSGFEKEYIAVCVGKFSENDGRIDAPIRRESEGIIKRCIAPDGKAAVSDYHVLEASGGLTLVQLTPHTGRTHQLRLHMASIGHPIFADFMYGNPVPDEQLRLHCRRIAFAHPFTNERIEITAPMPEDMNISDIAQKQGLMQDL